MKKTLLAISVGGFALAAVGQGSIEWGNFFGGLLRAPIYGREPGNPLLSLTGQSSLGVPPGNTVYSGPLLTGTGWTFAVFAGPAGGVDSSGLTLLASTTFRTWSSTGPQALPKGLVFGSTALVPGVPAGERCKFQIRVWDNWGGTLTSWEQVTSRDVLRGVSAVVTSQPLGGIGADGAPYIIPQTDGWSSFNIFGDQPFSGDVPEPSTWAMACLTGLGFAIRRFRHSR